MTNTKFVFSMASFSCLTNIILTCIFILASILMSGTHGFNKFESIISFGDSLADTGNLPYLIPPWLPVSPLLTNFLRLPYGMTYFHHPSGRWSDGRLVIDFIAEDFGLPFVRPYFGADKNASKGYFSKGVNFAVAGATALDVEFFDKYGVQIPFSNVSLTYQFYWFKEKFLPTFYPEPKEREEYLKNTLVIVGEIGGNDYNDPLFAANKTLNLVQEFVPYVIKAIGLAVEKLIELGAKTLLVPGNFPIGCTSKYLTAFQSPNKSDYDPETSCLNSYNEFSEYHNKELKLEIDRIQHGNPNVRVIYADNYNAAMHLYRNPTKYGFSKLGGLYSCCGALGPFNISLMVNCGNPGSYTCSNPSLYVCWDGLHYTEAANRVITTILLQESFNSSCAS